MKNLDSVLKSRDITLQTKTCIVKAMVFLWSCMDVRAGPWRSWVLKNWCFWTVVLEKTLKSPLDFKEIQPVHPEGNQFWIFIRRIDAEAETPILWPPDAKNWISGKDPHAGKDWRWDKKGTTENEMVGWHRWLNGHEFEYSLGGSKGQGGLACRPCGCKDTQLSDWTTSTHLRSHVLRKV